MFLILTVAVQLAAAPIVSTAPQPVPRMPLQSLVTADDYPAGLSRSAARPVTVALTVGLDGRVTECLVTASSGAALLDSVTCRLLRSRSRFSPAPGEVRGTIDWTATLSGASGAPLSVRTSARAQPRVPQAPWESISRLRVRLGQIGSCQWQSTGPVPPPPSSNACQNGELAGMALRMAAENKVDFNRSEVVVTLRLPGGGMIDPLPAAPAALVDIAAELEIGVDGTLTSCRLTRDTVRTSAPQRPDCRLLFAGPYSLVTDRSGKQVATRREAELRVEAR